MRSREPRDSHFSYTASRWLNIVLRILSPNFSCFNHVNVQCPWRPESSALHGAGVLGSCELLTRVGAGN